MFDVHASILESIDECGAHLRDECHTLQEQNLAKQLIGTRLFKYWSWYWLLVVCIVKQGALSIIYYSQ